MSFSLTLIIDIWSAIVMPGTHFDLCRNQMSQICDISPLRDKEILDALHGIGRNKNGNKADPEKIEAVSNLKHPEKKQVI